MPTAKFDADFTAFTASVDKAADKLDEFGVQSVKMSDTVTRSSSSMQSSFSQFDNLLASMGIHVGQEVKALDEMSNAAGQTAGSLGTMATAGLAVGTAMAAWNLTRMAMEWLDLDKYVAQAAQSLFNFASASDAVKGANQDVLDKASGIAKRTITDITEARAIIQKWADDQTLWFERSGNAAAESAGKVAGWHAEIAKVKAAGTLDALKADLESQNFSMQELSKRYGLHVEAIQLLSRETVKSAAAQKEAHDRMAAEEAAYNDQMMARTTSMQEALIAITKRGNDELTRLVNDKLQRVLDATVAEANAQIQLNAAMGRDASGAIKVQETALDALNAAMARLSVAKVEGVSQTAQQELITKQFTDRLYEEAQAQDVAYQAQLNANEAAKDSIAIKQAASSITGPGMPTLGNTIGPGGRLQAPGGGAGTPIGYDEYARRIGAVFPGSIGRPAAGGSISVTNQMSGLLLTTDPQARQQLMDAVNAAVTSSLRTSGAMR